MSREGWRVRRLGDFCHPVSARLGDRPEPPLLSVTKDHGVILQSRTYGKEVASADRSAYRLVRRGQFALAPMALYYGAIGRLDAIDEGIVSPAYTVFRLDESVDHDYVAILLRSPRMVARYGQWAEGGNKAGKRRMTHFSAFSRIEVTLPPLAEQRARVQTLREALNGIASTRRLVERLKQAKHWTMRRLLTEGLPAKQHEMAPLPRPWRMGRVAPGVTHMPAGWRLVRLAAVARLESGHTPSRKHPEYWGGDIPWLSLPDAPRLSQLLVDDAYGRITPDGLSNSSARLMPRGTVLLVRTGGSRGACSRLSRPMATSQDYVGFVPGADLHGPFLQQTFRHIQREWQRLSDGSTSLKNIFFNVFKGLQILLPPVAEQRAIAAVGEAYDARIAAESAALKRLTALKDGLARELLSGRLRVPPALVARLADDGGG